MAKAIKVGQKFIYNSNKGLGQAGRIADPDVPDEHNPLHPDMSSLDLKPGTEVEYAGFDEDRQMALVSWTDDQDNPRITSVPKEDFGSQFGGK